jgi:uncharacterized iron-regulated membrane protein
MTLRSCIFWPHLIAGTVAGVVVLVMSVTGVLLTYERQMIAWSDREYRSAAPSPGAQRLPVDRLLQSVRRSRPDAAPTAVTVASTPDAPVAVAILQQTLYVDAYTGALLGEGSQAVRRFMSEVRAWHRWLGVDGEGRPVARAVTGWSNLLFSFLVLSGLYLWLPKTWKWSQVKAVLLFRRASGKARDFNWHNVIGVWSALPLFIVVVSALPISFPWANAAVYRAVGEIPPAGRGGGGGGPRAEGAGPRGDAGGGSGSGLDGLLLRAERQVPGWRTINLRLPASRQAPVVFAIDAGDGGQPHLRSTLTLSRADGEVVSYEEFAGLSLGRRIRNVMRFAHTGEVLGIPGQTIAGIVSAGAVVLVWTGLALAWRRARAWVTRRSRQPEFVTTSGRSTAA